MIASLILNLPSPTAVMFSFIARRAFLNVGVTTPKPFAFRAFSEKLTSPTVDVAVSY